MRLCFVLPSEHTLVQPKDKCPKVLTEEKERIGRFLCRL